MRYYLLDPDFPIAGPQPPFLRFIVAPSLVVSTLVVMVSGLELWAFGAGFGSWWVNAHTASAVAFMASAFLHLLGHSRRSIASVAEDTTWQPVSGAISPRSVLLACGILSCILAAASLAYATPFGQIGGGG